MTYESKASRDKSSKIFEVKYLSMILQNSFVRLYKHKFAHSERVVAVENRN